MKLNGDKNENSLTVIQVGTSVKDPQSGRQSPLQNSAWLKGLRKPQPRQQVMIEVRPSSPVSSLDSGDDDRPSGSEDELSTSTFPGPGGYDSRRHSNLSLASLAESMQKFHRKRHGANRRSYLQLYADRDTYEARRDFLIALTKDFSQYGVPSHRLEFHLEAISSKLGLTLSTFVFPGMIILNFLDGHNETFIVKCPQGYEMGKLSLLNDLCFDITTGEIDLDETKQKMMEIRKAVFSSDWLCFFTYPMMAFTLCIISFQGSWTDSAIAPFLALFVCGLRILAISNPNLVYMSEFLSSFIVAAGANIIIYLLSLKFDCVDAKMDHIFYGALAISFPGVRLTTSLIEISSRNIISGSVKLLHALFTAALIGFGYGIGNDLTMSLIRIPQDSCNASANVSPLWGFLLFPPLAIAVCVDLHARKGLFPIMIWTLAVGFVSSSLLLRINVFQQNSDFATVIAAFLIGLSSNIYSRITRDIAIAPILSGIIILVPGSFGVKSFIQLSHNNPLSGSDAAMQFFVIGLCITVGLFLANILVWPGRKSREKYVTV